MFLGVVDFLLVITEFIVPSGVTFTGQTGIMAVDEDPSMVQKHIRLIEPLYMQQEETLVLSSKQRLFAHACEVHKFIYDVSGHTLQRKPLVRPQGLTRRVLGNTASGWFLRSSGVNTLPLREDTVQSPWMDPTRAVYCHWGACKLRCVPSKKHIQRRIVKL